MDKDKFNEKLYFYELEERNRIISKLQFHIGLIVLSLGFLSFILSKAPLSLYSALATFYSTLVLISVLSFGCGVYNYIRALWGHTYQCLPTPQDSFDYEQNLKSFYVNKLEEAENAYYEYHQKYIRECSSENTKINQKRAAYLHNTNSFNICCLISLLLAYAVLLLR